MLCWQLTRVSPKCWPTRILPLLQESFVPELLSPVALPLGTLASHIGTESFALLAKLKNLCLHCVGGGHWVKVICRSIGYAHGSISSSPCSFYGGADLCGAAGTPVERPSFAILCAALMIAFVS
jgi:hypothetical protein